MRLFFLLALTCWSVCGAFKLDIIHTNDVHSRYDEMNKHGGECDEGKECYGGMARLKTMIDQLRAAAPNTLLLDAGDYFQGTIWFFYYRGQAASHYLNMMKYDVMTLGNHEFDLGAEKTGEFVKNLTFPVVSANIDFSRDMSLKENLKKSVVKEVGGQKVGIVGFTTEETPYISKPGPGLIFKDVVSSVRKEAQRLVSQGVNKIIALGHGGFELDKKIAQEVLEVDVVVGGHTDTFLYTGTPPTSDKPEGVYPTVIVRSDGTSALCVQNFHFAKFLSRLRVEFDAVGNVASKGGNPILLDSKVKKDPVVDADVQKWLKPLNAFREEEIGRSFVELQGSEETCRQRECNLGNLVTDAMVHDNLVRTGNMSYWTDAAIAITNGGAIKATLTKGPITLADVLAVLPYRDTVDILLLKGSTIQKMLEHSVTLYELVEGRFLQFSGLKVWFDLKKPEGQRVVRILARCYKCALPGYYQLETTAVYPVLLPKYLIDGRDGFTMIKEEKVEQIIVSELDSTILASYVRRLGSFAVAQEGRINFL